MEGSAMTAEFADEILNAHNQYRAMHDSPKLKISEKLNKFAQEWAEKLAAKDKSEHRPDNAYGENIYMGGNTDPKWILKGDTVVKAWYDEIKSYKFGEPGPKNPGAVGHFTQLVWKGTTELGIGEAKSKSGKVYVVCNYDPPGNVIPEFPKNVLPSNQSSKTGFDGGQEAIVLTPSQEQLGIRFVRPNIKVIESMERLYAVPSEKLRVWSVWLTRVEEKANEWNSWLRSHINLILRMSEQLQRAENEINGIVREEPIENMRSHDEEQYRKDDKIKVEKPSLAADVGGGVRKLSRKIQGWRSRKTDSSLEGTIEVDETIRAEVEEDEEAENIAEETSSEAEEMVEESTTRLQRDTRGESTEDDNEEQRKISQDDEKRLNEEETARSKKITWPVGVPWEPVVPGSVAIEGSKEPKKKKKSVEEIAIPANEKDMQSLIKDVKEQATIFRSLYKHWLEVSDKAVKEVMNRTVMEAEQVPTDQEIPYFFYVNTEPDIDIGVEHDDEKILLPDLTREKIISHFTSLYFNLADKPGKA